MEELKPKQIRTFSVEFKKEKVVAIEQKQITIAQLSRMYQVSRSSVHKWVRAYGQAGKGERIVIEKESEAKKTENLQNKVAELERLLGQKQVEVEYLKKVIEVGSEEFKVDLKKKVRIKVLKEIKGHIEDYSFSMAKVYPVADITRQGYNQQLKRDVVQVALKEDLLESVKTMRSKHPRMGARKLFEALNFAGTIGINKFERLLSENGLNVPVKRNTFKTTNSNHSNKKYNNLLNGAKLTGINQVWATDITYFITKDNVYYITFILDVFSRRILGFSVNEDMRHEHNLKVLQDSFKLRGEIDYRKLIHHSDKGSQFCSNAYIEALSSENIKISMAGTSLENAYVERLNGILKNDYLYPTYTGNNLKSLRKALKNTVRLYNEERPHVELGNLSPVQFEKQLESNPITMKLAMELYDFELNQSNRFFKAFAKRMEQNNETKLDEQTASLLHSLWTRYSSESCSSAELSSASPDETNINLKMKNN
jgi:transposase InsO family protein/transposase-like protein